MLGPKGSEVGKRTRMGLEADWGRMGGIRWIGRRGGRIRGWIFERVRRRGLRMIRRID